MERSSCGGPEASRAGPSELSAPPAPRSPWQRLFAAAHRRRYRYYRERQQRLGVPVLSVGNLHLGGGGKTPMVAALAAHLSERDLRIAVLSRGYRRRGRQPLVVSRGAGPEVGPERAGDEPFLLAQELPGVAVVVAAERLAAGRLALARLDPAPQLFLLDDGFSHLGLARDLDLLVFPRSDPFGGGRLLPSGRLREPLWAAARADAVLLTGVAEHSPAGAPDQQRHAEARDERPPGGQELAAALRRFDFAGPGFTCRLRAELRPLGEPLPADAPLVLVSGVARPGAVEQSARRLGLQVVEHLRFPDHHPYTPRSRARIEAAVARSGARGVALTPKDRVKLAGRLSAPIVELRAEAEPEERFWEWLEERVERLLTVVA